MATTTRFAADDGIEIAAHEYRPDRPTDGLPPVVLHHGFAADTASRDRRIGRMVIVGDRDPLASDPEPLVDAISDGELRIVPGDHLSAVAAPEFADELVGFLAR